MPDHHHHGDDPVHGDDDEAALAELLDLDGAVLHSYWADALDEVQRAATDASRILDLGAGTGNGAIALAQRFPDSEVIAVDTSDVMLSRIRDKARDLGLAQQVRTIHADLDVGWPDVEAVDVTWASMSLHHLADPDRVLRDAFAATRQGGLLAVAEMSDQVRFLPDDLGLGRPGLEARCLELLGREHAESLPHLGADWAPRLEAAGFTVLGERTFTIALDPPHPPEVARYALQWLRRLRSGLADRLERDDLDALDTLIDGDGPNSLEMRNDLQIRGARTVTFASHR